MPSENKPRICTIFYCDRRRKSVCCSDCGFRRRGCYNSCKNDPAKCGLCKAPDLEGAEEKERAMASFSMYRPAAARGVAAS